MLNYTKPIANNNRRSSGGEPAGGVPGGKPAGGGPVGLSIGSYRDGTDGIRVAGRVVRTVTHDVHFYAGANLIEANRYPSPFEDTRNHGPRKEIKEFTRESRARLYKRISKFKKDEIVKGLFITLTYHRNVVSGMETKANLRAFIRRIQRKWPKAVIIWKLEYQKRGAVHYHLLVMGVKYIDSGWVARVWNEIAEPGDIEHLHAGTQVKAVQDYKGVMIYCGKYLSKEVSSEMVPSDKEPGRFWGIVGPYWLYEGVPVRIELTYKQAVHLYRFLDRMRRAKDRRHKRSKRRYKVGVSHYWYCVPEEVLYRIPDICA